jgi:hypothetical protein
MRPASLGLLLLIATLVASTSGCATIFGTRTTYTAIVAHPKVDVDITSDPPGAEVYCCGEKVGKTPLTVPLEYDRAQHVRRLDLQVGGYVADGFWVFFHGLGLIFILTDVIVDASDGSFDARRETRGKEFEQPRSHRVVLKKEGHEEKEMILSVPSSVVVHAKLVEGGPFVSSLRRIDAALARVEGLIGNQQWNELRAEAGRARRAAKALDTRVGPDILKPFLASVEEAAATLAAGARETGPVPANVERTLAARARTREAVARLERFAPLSNEVGSASPRGFGTLTVPFEVPSARIDPPTYGLAVARLRSLVGDAGVPAARESVQRIARQLPALAEANIAAPARRAAHEEAGRVHAALDRLELAAERRDGVAARAALAEIEPALAVLQALAASLAAEPAPARGPALK